jgi:hypothetical protein
MIVHPKLALPRTARTLKNGVPGAKTASKHTWDGVNANAADTIYCYMTVHTNILLDDSTYKYTVR